MKQSIRILIVDDHPMTVKGYEMFLIDCETDYYLEIESAFNCDQVLKKMNSHEHNFFNIVLLDINLPASLDRSVISGEDLGLHIRLKFPDTKIIVHTALNDQQRISNIFKALNPKGFLIKSDIESEVLFDAILSVFQNESYYSQQTNNLIDSSNIDEIQIDSLDRKILYYISIGEKMKNLPSLIPLSMATIERRKKMLKLLFDATEGGNGKLLKAAKEKGFI